MTFPATSNINYYMGDTHEFNVYPKDASNNTFSLAGYDTVTFVIAPKRGTLLSTDPVPVNGYAVFSDDGTHVQCAITPDNSGSIDPSIEYVYDVRVSKTESPYSKTFTLLTGNVSIQERVEEIDVDSLSIPEAPVSITEGEILEDEINISWVPSTEGGTPDSYNVYVLPYVTDFEDFEANTLASTVASMLESSTPFSTVNTEFAITATTAIVDGDPSQTLQPGTAYLYFVTSENSDGSSIGITGNFSLQEGSISETFTAGGS